MQMTEKQEKMKKILIVDDSAVMRNVLSVIIKEISGVCVADMAEDGSVAVQFLKEQRHYDLILLDINMPKLSGVGVLEFMYKNNYKIPTLIVSSNASKNTAETMRALELGAFDFVKKPGFPGSGFREQLLEKVHCAFRINSEVNYSENKKMDYEEKGADSGGTPVSQKSRRRKLAVSGSAGNDIIVIASSTGGPKALQSVIPKFPVNIGCPIVVVQHMPEGFTRSLADRLNGMSQCDVREAEDGAVLENGVAYVAKGGYQLRVKSAGRGGHQLSVDKDAPRNGLRPCADIFLESLLDSGYERIVCAVLTGMGSDATSGLVQLRQAKEVYAVGQSQESCVVYGMPRAAYRAGVVDDVAELTEVAGLLTKMVM